VLGVLSALPLISAGNICCCLWVVLGGATASYVLQQNQEAPITPGDGAAVGALAGVAGAFIYLALSIPITILLSPIERALMDRLSEMAGAMPPEVRGYATSLGTALRLMIGFLFMLFVGTIFSTAGGVLGAAIFRKTPPQTRIIDQPPLP
jgi:hypothetical protein